MSDVTFNIAVLLTMFIFGVLVGNTAAYDSIAKDCERLGAFHVNDKVFECKPREKK